MASEECAGDRIDWTEAKLVPGVAGGFILIVRGTAAVPSDVCLRPSPIGIVQDDYRGIEVLASRRDDAEATVETDWTVEEPLEAITGGVGIELIGATKTEFLPPKEP
jgi:hypothetical protein